MWWRTGMAGLVTGMLLGVLLMAVCAVTGYPLDRVLLDLSYTDLAAYSTPAVEWIAHLAVALIVSFVYAYLVLRFVRKGPVTGAIFGALTGLVYFMIMPQVAPELQGNAVPFLLWTACHAVYGIVLDRWVKGKSRS